MTDIENKYYQVSSDVVDCQPNTNRRWFKVGVALSGGSCLVLLSFVASSISTTTHHSTGAAESTSLLGLSPSLRMNPLQRTGASMVPPGVLQYSQYLTTHGNSLSALKKMAKKEIAVNFRSNQMRDISMKASEDAAEAEVEKEVEKVEQAVKLKAQDMAGVTAPLGFFDPLGFSADCSTGKLLFYREVELKHGRVGMLAALGFLVGESFHPLFGGNIDVPSYVAFQETPLQKFWLAVLAAISIPEVFSVFSFNEPSEGNTWTIKESHEPGNLGFDPLGLKPTNPAELKELQTKELNNGRLAMLAAAGMIAQELATGKKLF